MLKWGLLKWGQAPYFNILLIWGQAPFFNKMSI